MAHVFEEKVDHRNPKTGEVIRRNPWLKRVTKEHGGAFEQPISSGIWFHENHQQMTEAERKERGLSGRTETAAQKKVRVAQEFEEQKRIAAMREIERRDEEIAALQSELVALKQEKEKKAKPSVATSVAASASIPSGTKPPAEDSDVKINQ